MSKITDDDHSNDQIQEDSGVTLLPKSYSKVSAHSLNESRGPPEDEYIDSRPSQANLVDYARMFLNPGVHAINVFTLIWVVFAVRLVLTFAVSFMTTLVIDDYGVDES